MLRGHLCLGRISKGHDQAAGYREYCTENPVGEAQANQEEESRPGRWDLCDELTHWDELDRKPRRPKLVATSKRDLIILNFCN